MKLPALVLFAGTSLFCSVQAQTSPAPPTVDSSTSTTNAAPVTIAPKPPKPRPAVSSIPALVPPTQPSSRKGAWEKRALDDIAEAQAKADSIDLIFDGDSITDFFNKAGKGKVVWDEYYGKLNAVDFAISGDKTENVLWRLSQGQANNTHPKLIFLMIGTNNMQTTSTPAEIAAGVQAIVTEYQKRCPNAVIVLQAIFPREHDAANPYRVKVKATNDLLAKMGDGRKVIYIDFGDKFLSPDGTLDAAIFPDFIHPSEKGYRIWAEAIAPIINQYFPK